jgi:hypothetical protein
LVTDSGAVYSVPALPAVPDTPALTPTETYTGPTMTPEPVDPMYGVRLSPDGRWLARMHGFLHWSLRDLTTGDDLAITADGLGPWSDDGRWLALQGGYGQPTYLADLETGTNREVHLDQAHHRWQITAILGPGQVLLQRYDERGLDENPMPGYDYATVDPGSGEVTREYTLDSSIPSTAQGRVIAWTTGSNYETKDEPDEVLLASLETGHVTARFPLPAEPEHIAWYAWRTAGDGVALVRETDSGTPGPAVAVRFYTLDQTTGARELTCTLPGGSQFVVRR